MPTKPGDQPITAALSAAGSRRAELEALLAAATADASTADYRRLIMEENVCAKSSLASREKVWNQLRHNYILDPAVPEFRAYRWVLSVTPVVQERGLIAFLMFARADRLFREMALLCLDSRSAGDVVTPEQTEAALAENLSAKTKAWGKLTVSVASRHVLSSLKDFGLLSGSAVKRVSRLSPGPHATLFAAMLARLEGLTDSRALESSWFRLLRADRARAADLLAQSHREGLLKYRSLADVVELELPEVPEQ